MPFDRQTGEPLTPCCYSPLFSLQRGKHSIAESARFIGSIVTPQSLSELEDHPRTHYACCECGRLYVIYAPNGDLCVVPCSASEGCDQMRAR